MVSVPISLGLGIAVLATPLSLAAQGNTLHLQLDGVAAGDHFGHAVAGLGDLDGDGFGDLVVTAPLADPGFQISAGSVYVYSGATGALLYQIDGPNLGAQFGASVANIGDADFDGIDDFTVGAPYADINGLTDNGAAYTYSGATGALLHRFHGAFDDGQFGRAVAFIGDVDGDGNNDLLASEPNHTPGTGNPQGYVQILSVATGSVLYGFTDTRPHAVWNSFGYRLAGLGDLNDDGSPEFVVSYAHNALQHAQVSVRRSDDGNFLIPLRGTGFRLQSNVSFANLGDLDNDGYDDVGVADDDFDLGNSSGIIAVFSGITGDLISEEEGPVTNHPYGLAIASAGDIDGDGTPDYMFTAGDRLTPSLSSSVHVYSGLLGTQIFELSDVGGFGWELSELPDVDGDGLDDLIISAPRATVGANPEAGTVYLYR